MPLRQKFALPTNKTDPLVDHGKVVSELLQHGAEVAARDQQVEFSTSACVALTSVHPSPSSDPKEEDYTL